MSVFTFSDLAFMGAAAGAGIALDPDAAAYIARVEGASGDNQALEDGVKTAINDFVVGCKADGIWNAIKASCIMAGARTLNGALQPLVGTAPTRFGSEGGWNYNRKTGLRANGTDNYLNSNRNNNADPQNSNHMSAYATAGPTVSATQNRAYMGAGIINDPGTNFLAISTAGVLFTRSRSAAASSSSSTVSSGLVGINRSLAGSYQARQASNTATIATASDGLLSTNVLVFTRGTIAGEATSWSDARIAFYSIGESLNLALLDARITTLVNAFAAAIP